MSRLNIKAKVMYMPGPWGMNEPVKGADIKIIDIDIGGKDDVIFSKKTSSIGRVSGISKDWKDKRTIRVWEAFPLPGQWKSKTVADPTDMMLLEIDVREGAKHIRAPFVYLGNNMEVPIIVPWGKESIPEVIGSVVSSLMPTLAVDGKKYSDPMLAQKSARKKFEAGQRKVELSLNGPEALAFMPFADKSFAELKDLVDDVLPGVKEFLYPNPIGAAELSAIALIILASGAVVSGTILSSCVGFCLILALYLGYTDIQLEVVQGTASSPMPGIKFKLAKP